MDNISQIIRKNDYESYVRNMWESDWCLDTGLTWNLT